MTSRRDAGVPFGPSASSLCRHMSDINDLTTWNVLVGRVAGHWNRADIRVQPFSTTKGRFEKGAKLCAVVEGKRHLLTVRESQLKANHWVMDVGFTQTPQAEAFKGAELYIHASMRPQLPEDEFYIDELLGLRVVTEEGEDWGEIEEILETPAHDVYVTAVAMIPGVSEFVVKTDFENKVLTVRNVPGLRTDE